MDDRDESRRTTSRRATRAAGDRSSKLANILMKLKDSVAAKLDLPDEVRETMMQARKVTSMIARRRAERELAAALRFIDLVELDRHLTAVQAGIADEPAHFHLSEQWRTKLVEGGIEAAAEFPGGAVAPLPQLVHQARRERDTGKPPGAGKALFRHISAVLKADAANAAKRGANAEAGADAERADLADASDDDDDADADGDADDAADERAES